ncbi:MAG: hypothetical protein KDK72_06945 [Chlamydiia bacterium]|nr:hypothetical protein [Chlamydiia bacterium]
MNIDKTQDSKLWQYAESYLDIHGPSYCEVGRDKKTITLAKDDAYQRAWWSTALKVTSYFTLVLPILAIVCRCWYRSKYEFIYLSNAESFKAIFDLEPKQTDEDFSSQLRSGYRNSDTAPNLAVNNVIETLAKREGDLDQLLKTAYEILHHLVRTPNKENVKLAGEFYQQVNSLKLKELKHQPNPESHNKYRLLLFCFANIRKQWKLHDAKEQIRELIKDKIPDIETNDCFDSALECLHITWLHGSKSAIIKSAMVTCNGLLLPSGELKKKNISVLTGEGGIGASSQGINQQNLSGTGLLSAERAIDYSMNFKLNIDKMKNIIKKFIDTPILNDERQYSHGELINTLFFHLGFEKVTVIKRLLAAEPEFIKEKKDKILERIAEMKTIIEIGVLDKKNRKFRNHHGDWNKTDLRLVLANIDEIELILNSSSNDKLSDSDLEEISEAVPTVFASNCQYGLPVVPFDGLEAFEEVIFGGLKLGNDITHLFTPAESVDKVKQDLESHGLQTIKVFSFEVLKLAAQIDRNLRDDLYAA